MGKLMHDEQFRHVNYHGTDLKKTFARIRKQQAEAKAAIEAEAESIELEAQRKVRTIKGAK